MALDSWVMGHPKNVIERLVDEIWGIRHELKNEKGDSPHLENQETTSYSDESLQQTVYCGKVFSMSGWAWHDCGISFHAWFDQGKCKVWSPIGHTVHQGPKSWGTCPIFSDVWYNIVGSLRAGL
jgi:hypothetical protein